MFISSSHQLTQCKLGMLSTNENLQMGAHYYVTNKKVKVIAVVHALDITVTQVTQIMRETKKTLLFVYTYL